MKWIPTQKSFSCGKKLLLRGWVCEWVMVGNGTAELYAATSICSNLLPPATFSTTVTDMDYEICHLHEADDLRALSGLAEPVASFLALGNELLN